MTDSGEWESRKAAERRGPVASEADRKKSKARAMTKNPENNLDKTVDSEGVVEDLSGYVPKGENQRIHAVYRYWVHSNDGARLIGGITNDKL